MQEGWSYQSHYAVFPFSVGRPAYGISFVSPAFYNSISIALLYNTLVLATMSVLSLFSRGLRSKLTQSVGRPLWTSRSRLQSFSTAPAQDMVDDAPTATDIGKLQELFKKDQNAAKMIFSSTSKLTTGLRSKAEIRNKFEIHADEPVGIGGTDTAVRVYPR